MDTDNHPGKIDQLRRLGTFEPIFDQPSSFAFGHWKGGDTRADGSITMPYFEPSVEGRELVGALPVTLGFDWSAWMHTDEAKRFQGDYATIATATPEQLLKLTTALVRADRFNEGTLAWAFESGLLAAIVRRASDIVRWHDDRP